MSAKVVSAGPSTSQNTQVSEKERERILKLAADPNIALGVESGGMINGLVGRDVKAPTESLFEPGTKIVSTNPDYGVSVDASGNLDLVKELFEARRLGQIAADPEDKTLHVGTMQPTPTILGPLNDRLDTPGLDSEETVLLVNTGDGFTPVDSVLKDKLVEVRKQAKGLGLPKPVGADEKPGEAAAANTHSPDEAHGKPVAEKPAEAQEPPVAAEAAAAPGEDPPVSDDAEAVKPTGESLKTLQADLKAKRLAGKKLMVEGDDFEGALGVFREAKGENLGETLDSMTAQERYSFGNTYSKALMERASQVKGDARDELIHEALVLGHTLQARGQPNSETGLVDGDERSFIQGNHIMSVAYAKAGNYAQSTQHATYAYEFSTGDESYSKLHAVAAGQLAFSKRKHLNERQGGLRSEDVAELHQLHTEATNGFSDNAVLWHNWSVFEKKTGEEDGAKKHSEAAVNQLNISNLYHSKREQEIILRHNEAVTGKRKTVTPSAKETATGTPTGDVSIDLPSEAAETDSPAPEPAAPAEAQTEPVQPTEAHADAQPAQRTADQQPAPAPAQPAEAEVASEPAVGEVAPGGVELSEQRMLQGIRLLYTAAGINPNNPERINTSLNPVEGGFDQTGDWIHQQHTTERLGDSKYYGHGKSYQEIMDARWAENLASTQGDQLKACHKVLDVVAQIEDKQLMAEYLGVAEQIMADKASSAFMDPSVGDKIEEIRQPTG